GQRQKLTNGRLILEKSVVIGFLCVRLVLEFIKLVFNLPVTGIYSLMFQKVIISLVKVLLIFAFFIIGFGLAFNIGLVSQVS
uniref:Ion_trans domain-containing protein n=1 Tax=Macrostomum lignano TaxID=282301 RepID=A0A1I8IL11_9PLAT